MINWCIGRRWAATIPTLSPPPEGSEHAFRGEKPTPTRFSGNALLVSVTLAGAAGAVSRWPDGDESTALAEDDEDDAIDEEPRDDEDEATPNTADRGQPIDLSETTQL